MDAKSPDLNTLRRWCYAGLTQQEMADLWGLRHHMYVARSTIAMALARHGLKTTRPNPRYDETIPWTVRSEHLMAWDARMLRLHAREQRGHDLDSIQVRDLHNWRDKLRAANEAITYDPEVGFVRVPAHTDSPSAGVQPEDPDEPPF